MTRRFRFLCALISIFSALGLSVAGASDGSELILPVPQRSQIDGTVWAGSNCGPASLAMVLEAFGEKESNLKLRERANKLLGISSPNTGTKIEHLASIAQERGLSVTGPLEGKSYRRWTLDEARAEISAGRPMLVQVWLPALPNQKWNPVPTDHYIVLTGTVGSSFIFNDPADSRSAGYRQQITEKELTKAWSWSGAPFAGFSTGHGANGKPLLPPPPAPAPAAPPALEPPAPEPALTLTDQEALLAISDKAAEPFDASALPGYSPDPGPVPAPPIIQGQPESRGSVPAAPLAVALAGVMILGARLYSSK